MIKRLLLLTVSVLMCSTVMAQAVIKFQKTTHDFGVFHEKNVQTCEFVFENTGDKPLVIQQAYGSCGCMVANPPKDPIAPGAKAAIKVSYNGKGKFAGYFKKPITVRTNASNSIIRLYIKGNMKIDE